METPSLWSRLKQARVVQVLLVYLGASWGILQVVDVESTNGTFVNGERLAPRESRELKEGDELRFGAAKFSCLKKSTATRDTV